MIWLLALLLQEADLARICDTEIPWISDGVALEDGSPRFPDAPADRAGLLEKAKALAREQNRLILWYCPRVFGPHMTRAALLDGYAKVVYFTDPGLVDLVRAKFVPLRMLCDEKLGAQLGIQAPGFVEPGFVVLSPEGRVVKILDRLRVFNADGLRAQLVAVAGDIDVPKPLSLRYAGRHREILDLPCEPIHKGLAMMALGDLEGARAALEKEGSPEALYHLAAIASWTGRDPSGLWKKLVERHPESRWAWRAASNLVPGRDGLPGGPMAHQYEGFFVRTDGTPARRAVELLLRAQAPDGSWSDARYSYGWAKYMIKRRVSEGLLDPGYVSWPDQKLRPNVFVAVTALSALALDAWREQAPDRIAVALARADAVLRDDARVVPGQCEECYAEMGRLLFFTKSGDLGRMNHVVRRLAALQDVDGFWGHEYPSAFATAAVVHALVGARKAGAEVPEPLLQRAADALLKTRRDGGRQDYRHEAGKPPSSEKNSAGRTAIAELALYECGRGSLANVAAGVDVFWKHQARLEAVRACDNHADEELAGFFYYYAVYHTLEAARALGEPGTRFRDLVLPQQEADGSFVDSHELGKSYGTAMALLILKEDRNVLAPEERPRRMLNDYLVAESMKHVDARRRALEALKTPEDVAKRSDALRAKFLDVLGGFPERTPLNPKVTGVLKRDGYRVEKVIYEVRPDHHVTANLYLPDGPGPFPGVLFPLGHYDDPKPAEEYQRTCILFAKNGLAVLTYDPIGQGERYQTLGPKARGTSEHTLVDVGALLTGTCSAQYFIWEGMRGLDYLAGRPEVDPKRLGCAGNSGGGTLTAYLMALDERVVCAVPNCFITSVEKLYTGPGPQDGEANLRGLVAAGFGHSDYLLLRAPRPAQLSCPTRDYYDIEGAWTTYREAKRFYGVLGHAERVDLFEWDDKHSISKPFREAAVRWMRRWLAGVDDAPVEVDVPIEKPADLRCTASGQVLTEFREKTTYDFTAERARALAAKRGKLDVDVVRRLIGVEGTVPAAAVRKTPRGVIFETEPGIKIPGRIVGAGPRVLVVHGEGKEKAEAWPDHEVTAVDLRGMGETEPVAPHRGLANFVKADWKEAYLALNLGRPLLGQRVRDILAVAAAMDVDGQGLHLVGVGSAAPVALHAALLDPRVRKLTLEGMVISWTAVASTAITRNQLANVVPGALAAYDLPDLVAAFAPRPLVLRGSTDPEGNAVDGR
ncbi:MAG TPA: acetylxylan esterase [Planctomycetota bacterium]